MPLQSDWVGEERQVQIQNNELCKVKHTGSMFLIKLQWQP